MNTFKGKWSCISGRMEKTPMQSVLKEIEEETGIPADEVKLIREGTPIIAEGEGIEFKVYPFLFEANAEDIRLNWENTEYKWINPEEVANHRTVPKLKDVIEEVLQ